MRRAYGFLALAATMFVVESCERGPQKGDWYEDLSTGRRIKITDVGLGSDLLKRFRRDKEDMERLNTASGFGSHYYFYGDSSASSPDLRMKCILYVEESRGADGFRYGYAMIPIEYFSKDFKKISD